MAPIALINGLFYLIHFVFIHSKHLHCFFFSSGNNGGAFLVQEEGTDSRPLDKFFVFKRWQGLATNSSGRTIYDKGFVYPRSPQIHIWMRHFFSQDTSRGSQAPQRFRREGIIRRNIYKGECFPCFRDNGAPIRDGSTVPILRGRIALPYPLTAKDSSVELSDFPLEPCLLFIIFYPLVSLCKAE